MSMLTDRVREGFRQVDDIRDAGLTTPEDVIRFDDITYGTDSAWQTLDVYRPRDAEGALPVIVSVHGGAWVYGDKERYQYYCMDLCRRGFAVVNFTYRLAPEFQFPAPMEDTNLVFGWVLAHAQTYGFDTSRVFAVGDSAGAHMLSLYACICTNADYALRYDFQVPKGFVPKALGLHCGAYEIRLSQGAQDLTTMLMAEYLPDKGSEEEIDLICAQRHITSAFPPTFLMTAPDDFLRDQAPILTARLLEKEVPFTFRYYVSSSGRLGHVFHLNIRSEDARLCNNEVCAFFHAC